MLCSIENTNPCQAHSVQYVQKQSSKQQHKHVQQAKYSRNFLVTSSIEKLQSQFCSSSYGRVTTLLKYSSFIFTVDLHSFCVFVLLFFTHIHINWSSSPQKKIVFLNIKQNINLSSRLLPLKCHFHSLQVPLLQDAGVELKFDCLFFFPPFYFTEIPETAKLHLIGV